MKNRITSLLMKRTLLAAIVSLFIFSAEKSNAQMLCGAGFQYSTNGTVVQFWDSSYAANSYSTLWSFGNGTSSTDPNPVVQYNSAGPFVVCLTITDSVNGCTSTNCDSIYLSSTSSCYAYFTSTTVDSTVTFTDASSASVVSWTWDFGDGSVGTGQNQTHIYTNSGYYYVCLTTDDGNGCTDTYCAYIYIAPAASSCDATFTASSNGGNTFSFYNGSGALYNYYWDFGDGSSSTQLNPSHTYASSGSYVVCLNVFNSTCSDMQCDSIYVTGGSGGCQAYFTFSTSGNTIALTNASTGNFNYANWSFGDGTGANGMTSATHTYTSNGTYQVCLTIGDSTSGCQDSYCMFVTIGNSAFTCTIAGSVSGYNLPMDYAEVFLIHYDSVTQDLSLVSYQTITPGDSGSFFFLNVPSGHYLVKAAADTGAADYATLMPTYYQSSLFWSGASAVDVCPINFWVDIDLQSGTNTGGAGFIGGNVTQGANKMEAAGDPMSNVEILLLDMSDAPVAYTYTNANGDFSFSNIAYGTYKVYAEVLNRTTYPAIVTIDASTPSVANIPVVVNTTNVMSYSSVTPVENIESLVLYPNPAKEFATLKMNVADASDYSIEITDVTGKLISTQSVSLVQGQNLVKISSQNFADGIYMLHLADATNTYNLKLTVVK